MHKTVFYVFENAVLILAVFIYRKSLTFTGMQKRVLLHISFWLGYLLLKTIQNVGADPGSFAFPSLKILFTAQLALLIVKVPMVYALFYIFNKYLARQWNIIKTVLATLILFIVSLAAFMPVKQFIVIEGIYKTNTTLSAAMGFGSILSSLLILFFVCSIALAIKLVRSNMRQKELAQEIIKKKLETELQFLKAQTNPHFLFNTLNNIYALARKRSDQTADVVMKLSKLLRFMLYESQKTTVSIADEIQVVVDYIELEKIRYNEKLEIDFTRSVDNELQPIAPLILLPFVENAFKHGISENRFNSYIRISLELKDGQLSFLCENSKAEEITKSEAETIGLGNIRRQLELLYPKHLLEIKNEKGYFTVLLKINLADYATV
jgi:two-component system LytT family sensor kinase